jgi:hypothetical protein
MALLQSGTRIYGTANVDTQINIGANVFANTSALYVGNTVANITVTPSSIIVANSTVNVVTITSSNLALNGGVYFSIANTATAGPSLNANGSSIYIGNTSISTALPTVVIANSSANSILNAGSLQLSNATTLLVTLSTTAGLNMPNNNVNAFSHSIGTTFVVNTTALYYGTINASSNGLLANSTSITIGNSSVNNSINSTFYSGTANNANFIGGVYYSNVALLTGSAFSGNVTFNSNVTVNTAIIANGSVGGGGQVLTSNGSGVYWSTVSSSGGGGGGGGASVSVSGTSPVSPNIGDLWFNTVDGNLKIYNFSNGYYQWVDTSLAGNPTYNIVQNKQAIAFSLVFGGF